jgi:transposase
VSSPGLRWIVLGVVVRGPWTKQQWALPFRAALATTPEVSQQLGLRHKTIGMRAHQPHKPKDNATVEQGVLVVERWILAALRHRTFFSLAELNAAMHPVLERLNDKPFQKLAGSRRSLFVQLDRPALKPLERVWQWRTVT